MWSRLVDAYTLQDISGKLYLRCLYVFYRHVTSQLVSEFASRVFLKSEIRRCKEHKIRQAQTTESVILYIIYMVCITKFRQVQTTESNTLRHIYGLYCFKYWSGYLVDWSRSRRISGRAYIVWGIGLTPNQILSSRYELRSPIEQCTSIPTSSTTVQVVIMTK